MDNQDRGSARTSRRQFISVAGLAATAVIALATSSTAGAAGPTAPNPGSRVAILRKPKWYSASQRHC